MPQPSVLPNPQASGNLATANLVEIFSAIQGEGLNVGTRQLFIRFAGCDLRCTYCDSAHTWRPKAGCEIEIEAGKRLYETIDNPVSIPQVLAWVARLDLPNIHDSISLTGGEPLLHRSFLQEFLPRLKQQSQLSIYLETGGHRDDDLVWVLPYLDLIGMDIKLPSVSGESHWEAHERFLCKAHGKTEIFCKLIVSNQTDPNDLVKAAAIIRAIDPAIACFLQPMTPIGTLADGEKGDRGLALVPTPAQVLDWQVLMKQFLKDVRVIPQTHKMIDQK